MKTRFINIRVDDETFTEIEQRANSLGLTKSAYLIMLFKIKKGEKI
jgi:antitoxin component of RelBE/YafQ-DinJ toxin-antitoxin module